MSFAFPKESSVACTHRCKGIEDVRRLGVPFYYTSLHLLTPQFPSNQSRLRQLLATMSQMIEHAIDNYNRQPQTNASGMTAAYGVQRRTACVEAKAEAVMGEAVAQASIFEVKARGPNVGAGARFGVGGIGVNANVEFGRVEVNAGIAKVAISPNLNSAVKLGLDHVKVRILGFGVSIGLNGVSLMTPLGEVELGEGGG